MDQPPTPGTRDLAHQEPREPREPHPAPGPRPGRLPGAFVPGHETRGLHVAPGPAARAGPGLQEPPLALLERWYVVCPGVRLTDEPAPYTTCGRLARLRRGPGGTVEADVPGLPLLERYGYVWLWHGLGPPRGEPDPMPQVLAPRTVWECGTVLAETSFTDFVENTLDLAHPMYAHPYTHPTWWLHRLGVQPRIRVEVRPGPEGWTAEGYMGRVRFMWQAFTLPDRVRLITMPGTRFEGEVIAHHVPETATHCRMEYMMGRPAFPWEGHRFVDKPRGRALHRQDAYLLAGLGANRRRFGTLSEQHCVADAYTLLFRQLLRWAREGREGPWRASDAPISLEMRL